MRGLFSIGLLAMVMVAAAPSAFAQTSALSPDQQRALASAVSNAEQMEKDGRLAEALWWREVAQAITPDSLAAAQIKRTNDLIAAQVDGLLREADRLVRRPGGHAAAARAYQQVLQLDPRSQAARAALREMEDKAMLAAIAKGGGRGPAAPGAAAGR